MKKATAILTADIELRAFQPTCRIDDHWSAQERKIAWLRGLAEKHDCPILDAGDLFDKRCKINPSHWLLGWAIQNLPRPFYTIPGNHDLPGKSIDNYQNSAMAVLEGADVLSSVYNIWDKSISRLDFYLEGFAWGQELMNAPDSLKNTPEYKKVALIHAMVYEEFEPFPGCDGYSAKEVMDLLPDFDLIVTGHNHQTFTREKGGRVLVNPGSLMRNDADQFDFKPSVFLWYAEDNSIERVFVPIEEGVIGREHIDIKKEKENRLDAFVEKLGEQVVSGINFHDNLEAACADEAVVDGVKDKVWLYFEGLR